VKGGLSLSTPMITFESSASQLKPLGFMLTKDHLVTIRFHELRAFDSSAKRIREGDGSATPSEVFLVILEELVDSLADALEDMASELDALSTRIFDFDVRGTDRRKLESPPPRRRDLALRRILRGISNRGKVLGKIRASLLGLERIVPFVATACETLGLPEDGRFDTIRRDIESLDEFETRLAENVQFLLDAALGLINIEQNNVFRVLTVVSVVGVPPTLIASMYGMNFKHMPELDWTYGYPYALALILLSALAPILYFRARGWF
jgi:magnesium transporter